MKIMQKLKWHSHPIIPSSLDLRRKQAKSVPSCTNGEQHFRTACDITRGASTPIIREFWEV